MKVFPYLLSAILLVHTTTAFAASSETSSQKHNKNATATLSYMEEFESNPFISKKERKKIRGCLMPESHPIKPALDAIFYTQRATMDDETFAAAGFLTKFMQPRSFIRVASHPLLPGYLVKVYLDTEKREKRDTPGWQWFYRRIKGANKIRKIITTSKVQHFVVPQKWIYPIPQHPSPPDTSEYARKNVILVVENMNLVPMDENLHAWKTKITPAHLEELFRIITFAGGESYRADNIAYTRNGKFAFIDTEYPHKKPNYRNLTKYLSADMAAYWTELVSGKRRPQH